jgi:hypothetical protein
MRIVAVSLLLALCLVGCRSHVNPPPRPQGVPADAVWAGGSDGGSFIRCEFDAASAMDFCSVFNDHTGQLDAQGKYGVNGKSKPQDVARFEYSGFDGHRIYLRDGSVLVPVANADTSR